MTILRLIKEFILVIFLPKFLLILIRKNIIYKSLLELLSWPHPNVHHYVHTAIHIQQYYVHNQKDLKSLSTTHPNVHDDYIKTSIYTTICTQSERSQISKLLHQIIFVTHRWDQSISELGLSHYIIMYCVELI